MQRMLVLGGTHFIGRTFCERAASHSHLQLTLLNRGVTNPHLFPNFQHLICDRDDFEACRSRLVDTHWDFIVDFSGYDHSHIENIVLHCRYDHYTFLSSSAVELSWPEDELFDMARNKLWCEHLLSNASARLLVIRPGFVVGGHDSSGRFERREGVWVWRGTCDPVQPLVQVEFLTNLMLEMIVRGHTGVVRAGYAKPRVLQPN